MSHCLSNLSISHPLSNQTSPSTSLRSRFSTNFWINPSSNRNCHKNLVVKAESRDNTNLDHLQRQNKQQIQQPRRRSAPAAPIGLWDRFPTARTVQQMMDTMERMMEDPFAYTSLPSPMPPTQNAGYNYSRGRTPWEIKESESEYKMRFDMPGMTKDDVKVWVEEKMLVVKAEKLPSSPPSEKSESNEEENEEEWSAKSYGKYSFRIALPENVDFEKIKAQVKDGVLYVSIPKARASAKVLDINVE